MLPMKRVLLALGCLLPSPHQPPSAATTVFLVFGWWAPDRPQGLKLDVVRTKLLHRLALKGPR